MALFIAGGVLAALGIAAALLLMLAPFGAAAASAGLSLWLLFPLFTLSGYLMLVIGSRDPAARAPTRFVACPLLLISVAAAVVLVAQGGGLIALNGTAPVWYVLVLAGIPGGVGSAASSRMRGSGQGA